MKICFKRKDCFYTHPTYQINGTLSRFSNESQIHLTSQTLKASKSKSETARNGTFPKLFQFHFLSLRNHNLS